MASFYSSEGDHMFHNEYVLNQKLSSYQSSEHANYNNVYVSQPSVSLCYPNMSTHEHIEPMENRDEMVFISPTVNRDISLTPRYSDDNTIVSGTNTFSKDQVSQYHGLLSLSLGSQEQSLDQLHPDLHQYTESSLCSLFESPGKNVQFSEFTGLFCDSKYLKVARDLLDELVSVDRTSKASEENRNFNPVCEDGSTGTGIQESNNNVKSRDVSVSERRDLLNKLMKLLSMLEEVDRQYKQYWHQIQALISSIDMVVGPGASLPYTSLALRTISRQFRNVRDAIKKQIRSTKKSLVKRDISSHDVGVLSRLPYMDQKTRQQSTLHQFGHVIMRQPCWRPQRGLPENTVSVLRAWLFEHFLHPYPKDSEKIVLARETGLNRSQVANWFINARVRLWKPMIEEMYKEEFPDAKTELESSPQHPSTTQETSPEFRGSLISPLTNDNQHVSNESRADVISSIEIDARRGLT